MGKSDINQRIKALHKNASEVGLTVHFWVDHETGREQIVLDGDPTLRERFPRNTKGFRAAFDFIKERRGSFPQKAAAPLPTTVLCPMCAAVFAPTPELLASTHCPACDREFDEDDEWEEPDELGV